MSNLTGFRSADFRALQRRLVPRRAYPDKRQYMVATKKIRDAIRASRTIRRMDEVLIHELGHAVLALHHHVPTGGLIAIESKEHRLERGSVLVSSKAFEKLIEDGQTAPLLETVCAGMVSAFVVLRCIDGGRNDRGVIFTEDSDAACIAKKVLKLEGNTYLNTIKVHTAIMQVLLNIRVTARLSAQHIASLRDAVKNVWKILHANQDTMTAMLNKARDNKDQNNEGEYARISEEELAFWAVKIQEKRNA